MQIKAEGAEREDKMKQGDQAKAEKKDADGGEGANSVSIVKYGMSEKSLIEIVSQKSGPNIESESNQSEATFNSSFIGKENLGKEPIDEDREKQQGQRKIEDKFQSAREATQHKLVEEAEREEDRLRQSLDKASSLECILSREEVPREAKKSGLFELQQAPPKQRSKFKILTIPETKNKIGIYHFDSMSNEDSKKEYLILCKVFKHIVNYLFIKEINQRLKNSEIVYERDSKPFQPKQHIPSGSQKADSDWDSSSKNSGETPASRGSHEQRDGSEGRCWKSPNQKTQKGRQTKRRMGLLNKQNCVLRCIVVPRQKNGSDCGICVLENIERILFNKGHLENFKADSNSGRALGCAG